MLKKTMTYTDYDGVERTEDFYFNLSKAELAEMELATDGGLAEQLKRIVDAKDIKSIVEKFKEIILKAYGEKSPDGKYFRKEDDNGIPLHRRFTQTEAYSDLFMELAADGDAAANFINAIIPKLPQDHLASQGQNRPQRPSLPNAPAPIDITPN